MAFSDAIYGEEENKRYATESRLKKCWAQSFSCYYNASVHPAHKHLKYFYYHIQANNKILPVEKYNDSNMHIWPKDVL